MKAVVTRVSRASVAIGGSVRGAIGRGFLVLLGVGPEDTPQDAALLADKICGCRVFEDENGKMNRNLAAVGGGLLVVSQFTLYADLKSPKPGFTGAAKPETAVPLRAVPGGVQKARLPGGARGVRRGYAGGVLQ